MTSEASMTTPAHKTGRTVHTKGPWTIQRRSPGGIRWDSVIRGADGEPVASSLAAGYSENEAEANARLIAAAPDYAAAAALAITALSFEQEKAQRAGDELAYAQITQAKNALIAADNKRMGREVSMKDVTPARAALSATRSTGDQS